MTGREPMPFGKYKGTPLKDVPKDYRRWCEEQDWFEERWSDIADYWSMQSSDPDRAEVVMATKTEAKNINAEKELLSQSPPGFQVWWFRAYGNRLLQQGEVLYIPYLRVALEAWRAALTPVGGQPTPEQVKAVTQPPKNEENDFINSKQPGEKSLLDAQSKLKDNRDEEINF